MEKKKIILWQPTKQLFANAEKLDFTNEIIGQVGKKKIAQRIRNNAEFSSRDVKRGSV